MNKIRTVAFVNLTHASYEGSTDGPDSKLLS